MTATGPFYSNQDKEAPNLDDLSTPCRESDDPEQWFAESDSRALTPEQQEAKQLCGTCPGRDICLKKALDNDEKWGIWGGLTPYERTQLQPKTAKKGQRSQRQPINHGTEGGYKQHVRRHEKACESCVQASNLAKRIRTEKTRSAA